MGFISPINPVILIIRLRGIKILKNMQQCWKFNDAIDVPVIHWGEIHAQNPVLYRGINTLFICLT